MVSEFFTTNAPDPHHWTLNSCFGGFRSLWVHLGSFHYYMKLGAKWAEPVYLMQNFIPRSGVGIFTTNTPDPPHWTLKSCKFHSVWVHLLSFRNFMKLGAKRCELVQLMQKFEPRSHVRIFRNKRTQSAPLDPKLMFWCVAYCLGAF